MDRKRWEKIFSFQARSGWCGPAVLRMVLLSGGIRKSQREIANDVYNPWWGTHQQMMFSYLSRFFSRLGYKERARMKDLFYHLEKGRVIVVNWWDDLDPSDPADGHYAVVVEYRKRSDSLTLADPSAGRGIWEIDKNKFRRRWYDYLDVRQEVEIRRWMVWVDPTSKVSRRSRD